jgi:hypothetical protein
VRELLEQLWSTALGDSRRPVHDEILLKAGWLNLVPLAFWPAPRCARTISSLSSPTQTIETCGEPSGLIVTR